MAVLFLSARASSVAVVAGSQFSLGVMAGVVVVVLEKAVSGSTALRMEEGLTNV